MIPPYKDINQLYPNNAAKEPEPALPSCEMPVAIPTVKTVLQTAACHGVREYLGHAIGRTAGLGVFVGLVNSGSRSIPNIAGFTGALAAGTVAFLLGKHQIGTETTAQKAAVGLCTLAVAAAGGSIAACGSIQPVATLAIGVATTAAASLLGLCLLSRPDDVPVTRDVKLITFAMTTAASLTAACVMKPSWIAAETTIASRSIGIVVESSLVELYKSSLERVGPSINRQSLNFQGKSCASLIGLLPYIAATVIFNGLVSGMLQPANDSREFVDLYMALLIGALANAVKGATNTVAATRAHACSHFVKGEEVSIIRPSTGLTWPDLIKTGQKTAIRIFLSTCRNALYFHFREKGLSVIQAGCLAQGCYAFFAQNRDILFDLMQGEGWHTQEPVLTVRSLQEQEVSMPSEIESVETTND